MNRWWSDLFWTKVLSFDLLKHIISINPSYHFGWMLRDLSQEFSLPTQCFVVGKTKSKVEEEESPRNVRCFIREALMWNFHLVSFSKAFIPYCHLHHLLRRVITRIDEADYDNVSSCWRCSACLYSPYSFVFRFLSIAYIIIFGWTFERRHLGEMFLFASSPRQTSSRPLKKISFRDPRKYDKIIWDCTAFSNWRLEQGFAKDRQWETCPKGDPIHPTAGGIIESLMNDHWSLHKNK